MALVATILPGQLETPSAWRGTYFAFIFHFLKHKSKQGPFDLTFTCYTLGFPALENQQMIICLTSKKYPLEFISLESICLLGSILISLTLLPFHYFYAEIISWVICTYDPD